MSAIKLLRERGTPKCANDTPTPMWLDCDPGHDDAFAILLATHNPYLKLLGVSTVHGNASLAQTTANAGSILTALGMKHIPYVAGAAKPFCRNVVHALDIHGFVLPTPLPLEHVTETRLGKTGLDGTDLLPAASLGPVENANAIVAMREALMAEPAGKPWLVATGALTNIALLFATFPEVAEHIRGLSIMGGAIGHGYTNAPLGHVRGEGKRFGNHTPWAEFNIYCDPEAAQSLFTNPVVAPKTTLIPLDLTHQVLATKAVQDKLRRGSSTGERDESSDIRQMFNELLMFFAHTYTDKFGISEGPPLHDPLAVAVVLYDEHDDSLAFDDRNGERWDVHVVTDGIHSDDDCERGQLGRTIISNSKEKGVGVRIPSSVDAERFWDLVEECLQSADEWMSNRVPF